MRSIKVRISSWRKKLKSRLRIREKEVKLLKASHRLGLRRLMGLRLMDLVIKSTISLRNLIQNLKNLQLLIKIQKFHQMNFHKNNKKMLHNKKMTPKFKHAALFLTL